MNDKMRLCSLASGSTGNSAYFVHKDAHFLIDVGVSKKTILEELADLGEAAVNINGIFITHEHSDHIKGLGPFLRTYHVPVYLTKGTYDALMNYKSLGVVDIDLFNIITAGTEYEINGVSVMPIHINHDAAEPVAYRFSADDKSVAVVTDLGVYTDTMLNALEGIDACIIEANHDIRMLEMGPYPYKLKLRILGENGHLSNDDCVDFIKDLMRFKLKKVILGHLSKDNNLPAIAYETIRQGLCDNEQLTELFVASPNGHSEWITA